MKYNIRGQHIEVTPSLRDFVEEKLSRLEKYFDAQLTSEISVTLHVVKGEHRVEVTIPLPGVLLRAEERSADMYASIDDVIDKLERQIRKFKTKVNRKFRVEGGIRGLFKEDIAGNGAVRVEEEDPLELVKTKKFDFKPMDVEEAILQMNLIGHSFYVFANSLTKEVNVVYKRSDGRYGLIEQA